MTGDILLLDTNTKKEIHDQSMITGQEEENPFRYRKRSWYSTAIRDMDEGWTEDHNIAESESVTPVCGPCFDTLLIDTPWNQAEDMASCPLHWNNNDYCMYEQTPPISDNNLDDMETARNPQKEDMIKPKIVNSAEPPKVRFSAEPPQVLYFERVTPDLWYSGHQIQEMMDEYFTECAEKFATKHANDQSTVVMDGKSEENPFF